MNPLATLLNWLAPLLHPLGDFRSQVSKLATIHQNSVHTFSALAGGLVENQAGPEAFTGELETSFWESVQTYLNAENALIDASVGAGVAGGNAATMEGIVAEASATCEECAAEITTAAEVAAAEVAGDVVLDEVTGVVDAAAVAEVGANPIADVAAIILTLVAGVALLATLTKLAWDIYHAIQQWQSAMNKIADTHLSNLPPNPTPVPAPTSNVSPITRKLTIQEQHLVDKLLGEHPEASRLDIENLIKLGYDEKSIRAILDSYTTAKNGGKHSGWYKQFKDKSTSEIQKGIRSLEKQIQEHQDKIANPKKYIPDFDKLPPQQQKALVEKKWPSDIQRQIEQKAILEGILKDRGEK